MKGCCILHQKSISYIYTNKRQENEEQEDVERDPMEDPMESDNGEGSYGGWWRG